MKTEFNNYVEEYKTYSLREKQEVNIAEIKEILAGLKLLCEKTGLSVESLLNREIIDINKDEYSMDDYMEALYVYLSDIKNYLGTFGEWFADNAYISEEESK